MAYSVALRVGGRDMVKLVRCKSCGYLMPESKLGDKCPACGVPAKMFEPFEDPVGQARRRLLDAHLHPIAVHFPTAFAASLVVLTAGAFIFSGRVQELLVCAARLMSLFLPLLVIAAFLLGVLDGRTRFRSVCSILRELPAFQFKECETLHPPITFAEST